MANNTVMWGSVAAASVVVIGGGYYWMRQARPGSGAKIAAPTFGQVNRPLTVSAAVPASLQMDNPTYQFWYQPPGNSYGTGWQQDPSGYTSSDTFHFTPSKPGFWTVIVYARSAGAPTNETAAERTQWERFSRSVKILVV